MEPGKSQPTTRALAPQRNSLQSSKEWTKQAIEVLERLAVHYPRTDMVEAKWRLLFMSFLEEIQHKSIDELRTGAARYCRNQENKFYPTPGQLLEACRNPFDTANRYHSRPAFKDDLPPAMTREKALALIETTRAKYGRAP